MNYLTLNYAKNNIVREAKFQKCLSRIELRGDWKPLTKGTSSYCY